MKKIIFLMLLSLLASNSITGQTAASYCAPGNGATYNNPCFNPPATNDMIDNFWTTGGITNISNLLSGCGTSANNNYSDFTSQFLITEPAAVIDFNVQGAVNGTTGTCIGGSSGCFTQGFAIWIDWNQNGLFTDPGEKIYESPTSGHQVFSGSFTVPANINCDNYRMRVRAVFATAGANIDPCGNFSYGETEDYTVVINNCGSKVRTICQGETATIDYAADLPPNVSFASVAPNTNVTVNLPTIDFNPMDSTIYVVTFTSPDSVWIDSAIINVNTPLDQNVFAGLNDSICQSPSSSITLQGSSPTNTGTSFQWFIAYPGVTTGANFFPSSNTLTTNVLSNNAGSVYAILVESDTLNICPSVRDTALLVFSEEFHNITQADPTCNGFSDGQINISSFGTLGAVEYSIDNGGTWSTSSTFTGLSAGVYDVISRDIIGCSFSSVVTLTDPDVVTISAVSDTTVCQNGTAALSASSTNSNQFNWSFTGSFAANQALFPTDDSTVTVFATNFSGCSSDTLSINVSVYDPITGTIIPVDTICPGDDKTISVNPIGGLDGYDYNWTANGGGLNFNASIINMNPVIETNYCVTITDACESTPMVLCVNIAMREVPTPQYTVTVIEECVPAIVEFEITTPDNLFGNAILGTGDKQYSVSNNQNGPTIIRHTYNTAGDFDLYLKVVSPFGCENEINQTNVATSFRVPDPDFFINPEPASIFQPIFDMTNLTSGEGNDYTWIMPGGEPSFSNEENAVVRYPEGTPGEYPIDLVVVSPEGCTDTLTRIAKVINDIVIYAPNTFTPDGDSFNDFWRAHIGGIDIYQYHLQIFNRWGEIVFESFDPSAEWDGNFASGDRLPPGTYVWLIEAKDAVSSESFDFRGTVNLYR